MDDSERLVEKYLNTLGRGVPAFEPDGNIPPDFLLAGDIAVEVRRLNQNFESPDGKFEGFEQVEIPLWQRLRKLLPTLGPSIGGESWFVEMNFRRPLGQWKLLETKIRKELNAFMSHPQRQRKTILISKNFKLDLWRTPTDHGSFYLLGAGYDSDSEVWVLNALKKNLQLCIAEKERKIAPYRTRYREWWLVLTDHANLSPCEEDVEVFRTEIVPTLQNSFDKIVLLDPSDDLRVFEI